MTYDVIEEFTDDTFLVLDKDGEKKAPLHRDAGEKFIPATIHYPRDKAEALVAAGKIKLITPAPEKAEKVHAAKRK